MRSLACLCVLSGITLLRAQGTDRDHPLPLTTPELTGRVAANEKVELFYRFSAGPGDFRVVVDSVLGPNAHGSGMSTAAFIEDLDAKRLTDVSAYTYGAPERKVGRFQINQPRDLVLMLRAGGVGTYHVRLEGPVSLGTVTARQNGDATLNSGTPTLRVVLPRQGVLSIEMEDGTVSQIDLQKVRRVSVQP